MLNAASDMHGSTINYDTVAPGCRTAVKENQNFFSHYFMCKFGDAGASKVEPVAQS